MKNVVELLRVPTPFHLTALVGDDIGRSLLVATNNIFFLL